jgi:hypothetical protein
VLSLLPFVAPLPHFQTDKKKVAIKKHRDFSLKAVRLNPATSFPEYCNSGVPVRQPARRVRKFGAVDEEACPF